MAPRASWGPEGPSESSGGSRELPGYILGPFGATWGIPGRRPIITFKKQRRYKYRGFGAWAIFSDVKGRLDFVSFLIVFRSVDVVNWGGEFIVKHVKIEGFQFGPVHNFQENIVEKVGFGRDLWAPNINKIIEKPQVFQCFSYL